MVLLSVVERGRPYAAPACDSTRYDLAPQVATPYTHGVWQVKPGRADEFVAAWTELADWTFANVEGTGSAKLLRDLEREDRFVSFGPWQSLEAIEAWRNLDGFKDHVERIRELLVSFEPSTLEPVIERG
jgi:heme-degrading monooxygenase HmoA